MKIKLCVDVIVKQNVCGYVTNIDKIKDVLKVFNLTPDKLINPASPESSIQSIIFDAGRYVVVFQFNKQLTSGRMDFISYNISIENNFDSFADSFSNPKTLVEFHKTQEYI